MGDERPDGGAEEGPNGGDGHIELRSGRWHWYDQPLAAEDGDGSAILRVLVYVAEDRSDIMRRWLPGDGGDVTPEEALELGQCPDEREFFVPGGQCIAREDPSSTEELRRIRFRFPGGQEALVDSPGNRCLGDLTTDELCEAMKLGLKDELPEEEPVEAS